MSESNQIYYKIYEWMTVIPSGVRRDVYALLYGLQDGKDVQVSVAYIAERVGSSERSVQYAISCLQSDGLLEIEQIAGRYSVYKTKTPSGGEDFAPLQDLHPCKICTHGGEDFAPPLTDKRIQINNNIDIIEPPQKKQKKKKQFSKPTIEEVKAYCDERQNRIDPAAFWDFYESKGWVVGKSPMKDWRAAVRTWEKNNKNTIKQEKHGNKSNYTDNTEPYREILELANTRFVFD